MPTTPLSGSSILVIEGKASSAIELRTALIRFGANVHVVRTIEAGLMIASRKRLHGAILDCVSHGASLALCGDLALRRIPFMFYGGVAGRDGDEAAACMIDLIAAESQRNLQDREPHTFGSGDDWHHVA
jgi:hypothetical protein